MVTKPRGGGVEALVAGPLKKKNFLRLPFTDPYKSELYDVVFSHLRVFRDVDGEVGGLDLEDGGGRRGAGVDTQNLTQGHLLNIQL